MLIKFHRAFQNNRYLNYELFETNFYKCINIFLDQWKTIIIVYVIATCFSVFISVHTCPGKPRFGKTTKYWKYPGTLKKLYYILVFLFYLKLLSY